MTIMARTTNIKRTYLVPGPRLEALKCFTTFTAPQKNLELGDNIFALQMRQNWVERG